MCGITALFHVDTQIEANTTLLRKMSDSIIHRGPDDQGQYCHRNIGIGMRRLSIIDIETGHQPIPNEDKTVWVVLNGEIYNYVELKRDLLGKGHIFKTTSDTECIVHLYEEYGERCIRYLRGMFTFAIIDKNRNSLFVARDRLGIKPLFYYIGKDKILFASEIKAILQDKSVSREIDFNALDAYFTYTYIPSPLTIFKNIRKLEPGHFIKCDSNGVKTEKYWELIFKPDYSKNEKAFSEEYLKLWDESVGMHLMSDVPLGAFLSGGIDSGMLVAFMSSHMTSPVETFTMGFGGETSHYLDERSHARNIAEKYHAHYHEFEVRPHLDEIIDFIVNSFDEPFADDSVIPTYYICKLAKEHVTVALTGLGGDELFGGYERYLGLTVSQLYNRLPSLINNGLIRPLVENMSEHSSLNFINRLKRFVRLSGNNPALTYQKYISVLDHAAKTEFYSPELQRQIDYNQTTDLGTKHFNSSNAKSLLDKALNQDLNMYLPDDLLALSDRLSMHHSLELRVPYIDHKLVEFCATIPDSMKIRLFEKKYLLKNMAKQFLPHKIIHQRKQGFASPMASWLRNDLKEYSMELLSKNNLVKSKLFNSNYVERILQEHMDGRESHDKFIFSLMVFQKWQQMYC